MGWQPGLSPPVDLFLRLVVPGQFGLSRSPPFSFVSSPFFFPTFIIVRGSVLYSRFLSSRSTRKVRSSVVGGVVSSIKELNIWYQLWLVVVPPGSR